MYDIQRCCQLYGIFFALTVESNCLAVQFECEKKKKKPSTLYGQWLFTRHILINIYVAVIFGRKTSSFDKDFSIWNVFASFIIYSFILLLLLLLFFCRQSFLINPVKPSQGTILFIGFLQLLRRTVFYCESMMFLLVQYLKRHGGIYSCKTTIYDQRTRNLFAEVTQLVE